MRGVTESKSINFRCGSEPSQTIAKPVLMVRNVFYVFVWIGRESPNMKESNESNRLKKPIGKELLFHQDNSIVTCQKHRKLG